MVGNSFGRRALSRLDGGTPVCYLEETQVNDIDLDLLVKRRSWFVI